MKKEYYIKCPDCGGKGWYRFGYEGLFGGYCKTCKGEKFIKNESQ